MVSTLSNCAATILPYLFKLSSKALYYPQGLLASRHLEGNKLLLRPPEP